ncbi:hypothetical protein AZE42_02579 [Rhizopogon vesiculosus]|uniref:Uncharacterized protein n=1 Tax=Rhizopogon vesiculosus TaxID=180088 RepID=A0A1J8PKN9_9AGAM|nr:hypothetical protein AZE42_02579 [Rhizopogon vesiculosus]
MTTSAQVDPYELLALETNQGVKLNTDAPFTPTYVESSLTQSGDPQSICTSRVNNRHIVLENPPRTSRAQKSSVGSYLSLP